jgi:transcriptional regulator with XRE-family HTH domain
MYVQAGMDGEGHGGPEAGADEAEWARVRELNELLLTCRARMSRPELPGDRGGPMRQQDVADRAGVSRRWYHEFEHGKIKHPGADLADRVAGSLRMSAAQRSALHVLACGQDPPRPLAPRRPVPPGDDDHLRLLTARMDPDPAVLADETWTVTFANDAMGQWSGGWFSGGCRHLVCFLFSQQAAAILPDILSLRKACTAALRYQYYRNLSADRWPAVIACLTSSPEADRLWKMHEVEFAPRRQRWRLWGQGQEMINAKMYMVAYQTDRWVCHLVLPEDAPPPPGHRR